MSKTTSESPDKGNEQQSVRLVKMDPYKIVEMIQNGDLERLQQTDIANYDDLVRLYSDKFNSSGISFSKEQAPRIFVVAEKTDEKGMIADVLGDGSPLIIISSSLHKVTPEYILKKFVPSIEIIDREGKDFFKPMEADVSSEFLNGYNTIAKAVSINPPRIYLDKKNGENIPIITISETQKGEPYVKVNQTFLEMPTDKALSLVPHEFEHYKRQHTKPEKTALRVNDRKIGIMLEAEADDGFRHLCKPSIAASFLNDTNAVLGLLVQKDHITHNPTTPPLSQEEINARIAAFQDGGDLSARVRKISQMPENTPNCFEIKPTTVPVLAPSQGANKTLPR